MFEGTFTALKKFPEKVPKLWAALTGDQRDPETPISVVGASRIGGELFGQGDIPRFLLVLAALNFFVGIFNLFPLLPLDGGHIAIAWFEKVRSWLYARLRKPDPGRVDYYKLTPLMYVVILIFGGFTLLTVAAAIINPITLPKREPRYDRDQPRYARHATARTRETPREPADHGRFGAGRRRRTGLRTVDDDHRHGGRERDLAADRRADGGRVPDRPGRGAVAGRRRGAAGDRAQVADPRDRRHPLPAQVRLRGDRRGLRGGAGEPGQHQEVRRQGGGDREGGGRCRRTHPHRRQCWFARPAAAGQVRQGHGRGARRVRLVGVFALRGARLPGHQNLGEAQRPGGDDPGVPPARRGLRLPVAPRCDGGRPRVPRHDQVGGRVRRSARRRHRRHHPGVAVRPAGRRGQGRERHPRVARAQGTRLRDRLLPVLRARAGRRLRVGGQGHGGPGGLPSAASRRRHGVCRQRSRRGSRG